MSYAEYFLSPNINLYINQMLKTRVKVIDKKFEPSSGCTAPVKAE